MTAPFFVACLLFGCSSSGEGSPAPSAAAIAAPPAAVSAKPTASAALPKVAADDDAVSGAMVKIAAGKITAGANPAQREVSVAAFERCAR